MIRSIGRITNRESLRWRLPMTGENPRQPWPDRENRDPRRGGRDAPSDKLRVVTHGWGPDEILRTLGATGADLGPCAIAPS